MYPLMTFCMLKRLLTALVVLFVLGAPSARAGMWTVDLNAPGTSGADLNQNALFYQNSVTKAGTGVLDPFLTIQQSTVPNIYGYNNNAPTSDNPYAQFGGTDTHLIQLSALPEAQINGGNYREFVLDANQTKSDPSISLVKLQIYTLDTGGVTSLAAIQAGKLVYDLDNVSLSGGDGKVTLHTDIQPGSGYPDMFFYIKSDLFGAPASNPYVYIFAQFDNNNDGFEEFARSTKGPIGPPAVVPAPSSVVLLISGLTIIGLGGLLRFRRRPLAVAG